MLSLPGQAFQLLSSALRNSFGLNLVGEDHDLDPIHKQPELQRMVQAARALGATGR